MCLMIRLCMTTLSILKTQMFQKMWNFLFFLQKNTHGNAPGLSSGLERIFDNVRRLQSKAGQAQAETFVLRGNIEADATCIRKCPVSMRNRHFADGVAQWKAKNTTSEKKFK